MCRKKTSSGSRGDQFMYCVWFKYRDISPSWRVCLVCEWKCSPFQFLLSTYWTHFPLSHSPKKQQSQISPGVPAVVFLPQLNSLGIHPVWHMAKRCVSFLAGHGRFGVTETGEAKGSPANGFLMTDAFMNLITYPLSTATKRGAIIATSFCDVSSTCGLRGRINSYLSVAGFWWFPQHLFLQNSDLNKQKRTKNVCI